MSGRSMATPFCHGVQGTKRTVYLEAAFSRLGRCGVPLNQGPTATSEGCTASGGLVRISCLVVDEWIGYFEKVLLS